ncbi:MAG: methionine biosynthesis protein MetW [Alphaproteobacteria bacterium]|nr:methionine biosynthesis protein MetW [Alphaproteobacteria bacterium]
MENKANLLRPDLAAIAGLVAPESSLIDVGCGEGDLLAFLQAEKKVSGRGIELGQSGVNRCIARGLSVIQGDADTDLQYYPDAAYDYAILSQTLQTLRQPKEVVEHLVRIAKHAIVSVPNFGHWKNRLYLMTRGRMPVTKTLSYSWYDTPNIHFCTINDFIALCDSLDLTIEKQLYVDDMGNSNTFHRYGLFANSFGQQGIFMVRK